MTLSRRGLFRLAFGSAVASGCARIAPEAPVRTRLAARLGLEPGQAAWLDGVRERRQERLLGALDDDAPLGAEALDSLRDVIGPRSRLFAYVGYPEVADRRSVCDGLVRE